ncbi:hypothetical protein NFI96_021187, partial [Prochilodus magdalenae]
PPRPTLTVEPETRLFTGESFKLSCVIDTLDGWTYQWSKQNRQRGWTTVSRSKSDAVNTLTISRGALYGDQYRCRGERYYRPKSSQDSNTVTLTVEAPPKPTLTVEPKWSPLFTGESVTLKCAIDTRGGRTYQWGKLNHGNRWTAVSQSEYHTVNRDTLTIRGDPVISGGQYCCRGEIPNRPKSSQNSDSFTLTVEAERPKPELTSSHKGAAALIGNPVVLNCKVQSSGWKFYWSKQTQNPENETETETPSYTISSVSVSDRGEYRCRAGRGDPVYYTNHSDALWITVTGGAVILESPVHPVPEGDPLTLRCSYRHTKPSNLTAEFYKNGSLLQTQTTGEMTIRAVSKSDEGLYHCKHPEGGESPPSWISVRGSTYSAVIVGVTVTLSLFLIILILSLFWCYKRKKGLKAAGHQSDIRPESRSRTHTAPGWSVYIP